MYHPITINLLVLVCFVAPMRGAPSLTPNELLSRAASHGDTVEMRRLMTNGSVVVEVDHPDDKGRPPLLHAANAGHHRAVKMLLEAGADPNARGHDGDTAFFWAAASGHTHIMRTLLAAEDIDTDSGDVQGRTPLFAAACNGRLSAIKLLLDLGADPDTPDYRGISPVMCTRNLGCDKCVRVLRTAGAVNIDWMESVLHPLGG